MRWYNQDHKHSGLKFVTPAQRHCRQDAAILERREQLYHEARNRYPKRWSQGIRNWLEHQVRLHAERIPPEALSKQLE